MEKNKKRATRRAARQKKLRKAIKVVNRLYIGGDQEWQGWKEDWARRNADNLKGCSCFMCCNPRHAYNKKTLQEKRFQESIKCESLND